MSAIRLPWPFWLLLGITCLAHALVLDWGTPNRERSLLVFGSMERIGELTNAMVTTRDEIYEGERTERGNTPRESLVYPPTADASADAIHPDMVNSMRSYLLRSTDPDEQQVISAIANMDPLQLDFDPDEYKYGGAYLYSVMGALGSGMVAGVLPMRPGIQSYFQTPEDLAWIFIVSRAVNTVSVIGAVVVLVLWGTQRGSFATGLAAGVLYGFAPLVLVYGGIAKPNLFAAFWVVLGVFLFDRWMQSEHRPLTYAALMPIGAVLGMATGGFVVAGIVFPILALWLLLDARLEWKPAVTALAIITGTAVVVFLVTNPFFVLSLDSVLATYGTHLDADDGWGYGVPTWAKLSVTLMLLPVSVGLMLSVLFMAGVCERLRARDGMVISLLVAGLGIAAFMGHIRFQVPLFPLYALVAAMGYSFLLQSISSTAGKRVLTGILLLVVAIQAVQVIHSLRMDSHHRNGLGAWVNRSIPPADEIGIHGKKPIIWHTPPFRFEQYTLRLIPGLDETDAWRDSRPPWLIIQHDAHRWFGPATQVVPFTQSGEYRLAYQQATPWWLGILPAVTPGYNFPCQVIEVWQRVEP